MSFLNPWGLLALSLILPLVLLYMLKKQHEDLTVSSTILWQQVMRDLQATRPWQRLRTRLLLILQIAAILLFALALARPVFFGGDGGVHYIVVVDTSARMQATDVKPSRMDSAREDLLGIIQSMTPRDTMTIIQAGIQPLIVAGPTDEKSLLRDQVSEIHASNGQTDLALAVQFAQTLFKEEESGVGHIHVFSDRQIEGFQGLFSHLYSDNGQNAAVVNVSYVYGDNSITALSRIANYGDDRDLTLELRVDGALINIKEAFVPAGEEANIYWTDIPANAKTIEVLLSDEDDLLLDNYGLAAVSEEFHARALLVTERNVYLERAVSLRSDIELLKANPGQEVENHDFQLYLFDGSLPENLPQDGHMLIFNPVSNEQLGITVEGEIMPSGITVDEKTIYPELVKYIAPEGYQVAKAGKINVPDGFDVLLADRDGNPMLVAGELDGRKAAVFPFSLHQSNLPLKADFPILIQNLLNWMLPPAFNESAVVYAGEAYKLSALPDASEIIVTAPSGKEYRFDAYPAPIFYDTNDVGIYHVVQRAGSKSYEGRFVVSVPTGEVSDLRQKTQTMMPQQDGLAGTGGSQGQSEALGAGSALKTEIWLIAGWVLLILLLIEWWVYHHGV